MRRNHEDSNKVDNSHSTKDKPKPETSKVKIPIPPKNK